MRHKAVRYSVLSQLFLYLFVGLCMIINPHFLTQSDEGGISNYGLYAKTVVPYSLGLGLSGILVLRVVKHLPHDNLQYKSLKRALTAVGIMYLLVLLSTYPYHVSNTFKDIHLLMSTALLASEMSVGIWAMKTIGKDKLGLKLFVMQIIGFALVFLVLGGFLHILMVAELVAGLPFAAILIKTMNLIDLERPSLHSSK
jgi:hypothetical protein